MEISQTNANLIINYLESDINDDLKRLVIRSLRDDEVNLIYDLCSKRGNVLIAQYMLREEKKKREYNKGL